MRCSDPPSRSWNRRCPSHQPTWDPPSLQGCLWADTGSLKCHRGMCATHIRIYQGMCRPGCWWQGHQSACRRWWGCTRSLHRRYPQTGQAPGSSRGSRWWGLSHRCPAISASAPQCRCQGSHPARLPRCCPLSIQWRRWWSHLRWSRRCRCCCRSSLQDLWSA